jgi:hypothetical protein
MENYAIDDTASLPPVPSTLAGDMRFMSWVAIIGGALNCLSIVGALIGVPVLISGLRLKESADELDSYKQNGSTISLSRALELQSKYFSIQKIIILIAIVLVVLAFIAMFVFGIGGLLMSRGRGDY